MKAGLLAICSAAVSYFYIYFWRTNYLNVYWTDLRQIYRTDRTMAVDDHSEIEFFDTQGTLPWQPNFVGFGAWVSLDAGG